jgi:Ni,Fe-hydrogenase I small subunit
MNLLWLQSGGCGGCTMSLLCSSARDLPGLLEGAGIHIAWHPSLSEATGDEVRALLAEFESGARPLDLLCVEGAMLTGPEGTGRFHLFAGTGRPMIDWVRALAARARYTLAMGSCSAYGGMRAGLQPHRRHRAPVRRRPPGRAAGGGLPLDGGSAGDQRGRLPHPSGLGGGQPAGPGPGADG